jgi:hypothetical protein
MRRGAGQRDGWACYVSIEFVMKNAASLTTTCPGCGLTLDLSPDLPAAKFHSTAECWAQYGHLAAWTLSLGDPAFAHQHVVDCYAAQHIGPESKPIVAVFALVGIFLALEHGATGRQAQLAHMKLGRKHQDWPRLEQKTHSFDLTVEDILKVQGGPARSLALKSWMECVWSAWRHEHGRIRTIVGSIPRI